MEASLLKFIQRVRAESSTGGKSGIDSEYTNIKLQNGSMKQTYGLTANAGGSQENIKKNRYKDILPYDQTRVVLSPITPEYSSDYINANFIKGVTGSRRYIATQGPLSNTVVDFWRMIWEYEIQVIIMACKEFELGKNKCEVYWSPLEEASSFGPFTVSTVKERQKQEEVIVRTLAVKRGDETRTLSHFQYTAWPDHGIPDVADGILGMMETVHVRQGRHTGPLLVHCSAGCGRTGVICAIDIINDLLHEKKIRDDFSIMDIVLELRRQRPSAVQTKEQYEFLFHTVSKMFEKVLRESEQNRHHSQLQLSQSLYTNVVPPKPALRTFSIGSVNQNTRKPPVLRPRSSHPPPSVTMSDTYAVVNKIKRPPTAAPLAPHHYDNEKSQSASPSDLYSIVKPKNRPATGATAIAVPVYNRAWPANHKVQMDCADYEPLPGVFQVRGSQLYPSLPQLPPNRHSVNDDDEDEDDYEYVSNPIRQSSSSRSSSSSTGGMGFKCRIRKPKGPRDPPSQWNRPER